MAKPPKFGVVEGGRSDALDAAIKHRDSLLALGETTQAHLRLLALAEAQVWSRRADAQYLADNPDAARKCASSASEASLLAARLEKESLADRVAALEDRLTKSRRSGVLMADLDD